MASSSMKASLSMKAAMASSSMKAKGPKGPKRPTPAKPQTKKGTNRPDRDTFCFQSLPPLKASAKVEDQITKKLEATIKHFKQSKLNTDKFQKNLRSTAKGFRRLGQVSASPKHVKTVKSLKTKKSVTSERIAAATNEKNSKKDKSLTTSERTAVAIDEKEDDAKTAEFEDQVKKKLGELLEKKVYDLERTLRTHTNLYVKGIDERLGHLEKLVIGVDQSNPACPGCSATDAADATVTSHSDVIPEVD
jgi:hypothetical protein